MLSRTTKLIAVAAAVAFAPMMACTGARGQAQTPVELAIAPIASLSEAGIVTTGERSPVSGRCSLRLVAAQIDKSSPGCFLDEHISEGPGTLSYPCGGDGPAEADFGEHRYVGKMEHGELELELSTELDWEDGCRWGTDAVISGTVLVGGEPTLKKLAWRYRDRVIDGSDCSGLCTARTTFVVTTADYRFGRNPSGPDEED